MLGPRIEHQLLGLIGPLVNLAGTARGEAGVRQAVDEQQGPRRAIDGALGPVGLGESATTAMPWSVRVPEAMTTAPPKECPTRTTRAQSRPCRHSSPARTSSPDSTYTPGWR